MTVMPVQITFRGLAHSEALQEEIRERVAWLEQFYADIVGCRVLVDVPHRHRHSGRHLHVRIEVTVPGGDPIAVSHELSLHGPSKDTERTAHHKESEIESVHRYARVAIHDASTSRVGCYRTLRANGAGTPRPSRSQRPVRWPRSRRQTRCHLKETPMDPSVSCTASREAPRLWHGYAPRGHQPQTL